MASTYLSRTPSSAGNRKTYTYSLWVKRAKLGSRQSIKTNTDSGGQDGLYFDFLADDTLLFGDYGTGAWLTPRFETTRVFRDTSAWYHIVVSVDTTQSTEADRFKMYINGVEETSFDVSNYPSQNLETKTNRTDAFRIGALTTGANYFDGQMTHFHFIDGTAYDADTFGETDSTTGEWKPKSSPSVTYGTNGFFLKFENASSFGEDSSGNNNDFTSNGSPTQLVDTPANILCTLNPLNNGNGGTLSITNTKYVTGGANDKAYGSTLAFDKGKWYWEIKMSTLGNRNGLGVADVSFPFFSATPSTNYAFVNVGNASTTTSGTHSGTVPTFSSNDIICFGFDADNNKLYYSQNANLNPTTANSFTLSDATYTPAGREPGGTTATNLFNFGNGYFGTTAVTSGNQDDAGYGTFEYDVPTGYYTLNTKNINTYG